jgi:sensor c-di-GMP phosphodiesterase-like protein
MIAAIVWLSVFAVVVAVAGGYAFHKTSDLAGVEGDRAIEQFTRLRANLLETFDMMHAQLTAEPCSPAFRAQLRRVAYLPDGLNEFLYAPGGYAQCSLSLAAFEEPLYLGAPDLVGGGERRISLWIDRDLSFLGLPGEKGTLALSNPFVAVVPPQRMEFHPPQWLSMQLILRDDMGRWFHRAGKTGLYEGWLTAPGLSGLRQGRISTLSCDPGGVHCIVAEVGLATILGSAKGALALGLLAAAAIAAFASSRVNRFITRFWSFEQRFCRHLDADSVRCAYQPVMQLDSGEIAGCEVLVRWRDVNDQIVFPDRFIEIVKRRGLTMRLTQLVARRAFEELSAAFPAGRRLQVSINIFPQDLDSARLLQVFSCFTAQPDRFCLILEIIESDEMPASAQREIELLRRAGIKTYIDDFGTGYSNMQSLAGLSVDGVKLDRAFAMAPDNSMMAQMLRHAVEMIEETGRVMVVEGVETAERLALLRGMQARIDFVQGYFIARPLDIAGFAAFLRNDALVSLAAFSGREAVPAAQRRPRDHIQPGKIAV